MKDEEKRILLETIENMINRVLTYETEEDKEKIKEELYDETIKMFHFEENQTPKII